MFVNQKALEIAKSFYCKKSQVAKSLYCKVLKYESKSRKRNFDFKNNFKRNDNFV